MHAHSCYKIIQFQGFVKLVISVPMIFCNSNLALILHWKNYHTHSEQLIGCHMGKKGFMQLIP